MKSSERKISVYPSLKQLCNEQELSIPVYQYAHRTSSSSALSNASVICKENLLHYKTTKDKFF